MDEVMEVLMDEVMEVLMDEVMEVLMNEVEMRASGKARTCHNVYCQPINHHNQFSARHLWYQPK